MTTIGLGRGFVHISKSYHSIESAIFFLADFTLMKTILKVQYGGVFKAKFFYYGLMGQLDTTGGKWFVIRFASFISLFNIHNG